MQLIVGLSGYAGSGKDALGAILCEHYGFERVAFADAIKQLAVSLGWDGVKDERGRRLLQHAGMCAREYNPEVWIEKAMQKSAALDAVVITDVRFANEVEAIKRQGGIIVRVIRDGIGPVNNHASEMELGQDDCDFIVHNDGTLDDLAETARLLFERIEYGA